MLNIKLTTKILLIGILLFVLFTVILGVYFDNFLKNKYNDIAKEKILSAKDRIQADFKNSRDNLIKGVDFIENDMPFIASVDLINNYQDKENYNAILLDEEKKEIAQSLLSRVKRSFNSEIRLYSDTEELIAYVFKENNRYKLNFISYENSKKILYSKYEDEELYEKKYYIENPDISFIHKEYYTQPELMKSTILTNIFKNGNLVIKTHKSFFDTIDTTKTKLHIEMSKVYTQKDFVKMSKEFDLHVSLSQDEQYKNMSNSIFDKKSLKDEQVYITDEQYLSSFFIELNEAEVYILLNLDKTSLNSLLKENRVRIALFLLFSIFIMVIIFSFFMNFGIKTPLENLMKQISKIKTSDYSSSNIFKTGDELEEIGHSINELALAVNNREKSIRESQEKLEYLSTHDELTGLLNRRSFSIKLDYALSSANRNGRKVAILFLDLDQFKGINDTLGHTVGDSLLILVSHRLEQTLRKSDVLARVGGDEFNIFIEGFKTIGEIQIIAQKIVDDFAEPFVFGDHEITTSTSIGISIYPDDGLESEILIKNADLAMYESKNVGRNTYNFYSSKFSQQMQHRTDIINALKLAIKSNDEFTLHYQPKISIKTKQVIGAEALIRWNSRQLGVIYPDEFIKISEDTHLIIDIGRWVLEQACKDFVALKESGIFLDNMSVNVSGIQLKYSDMFSTVKEVLSSNDMIPSELELEVTESYIATNEMAAIKTLTKFRDFGVELAIDDFGTGYSSLSYLQKLPVTRLKIDKAFVDDLPDSSDSVAVAITILSLAEAFNLKITVEGVEEQKQLDFFEDKHCDDIQGYFYSKPLPLEEFKEFFLKQSRF